MTRPELPGEQNHWFNCYKWAIGIGALEATHLASTQEVGSLCFSSHLPNVSYSEGIGSLAAAIPLLKVMYREKL